MLLKDEDIDSIPWYECDEDVVMMMKIDDDLVSCPLFPFFYYSEEKEVMRWREVSFIMRV